jgi:hypothetical protein
LSEGGVVEGLSSKGIEVVLLGWVGVGVEVFGDV